MVPSLSTPSWLTQTSPPLPFLSALSRAYFPGSYRRQNKTSLCFCYHF